MPTVGFETLETLRSGGRVHVGTGPVGLLMTALLRGMDGLSVRLYEKRREYLWPDGRLASYLVADSVEGYRADHSDGYVEAVFDQGLAEGVAFRQSIPSDLMALLRQWTRGFCPLNEIEQLLQRSDRCTQLEIRWSGPRAHRDGGRRDRDARAGGRADRLQGQVAASRSPGTRLWRRGRARTR